MQTIYEFKVLDLEGNVIDFSDFRGKKIMVVNVASECSYTPQYQQLEELYEEFEDLVVVGFPSNDFGGQEPGTNEEIRSFCNAKYGVSFPMAAKVHVTGAGAQPVYRWLTQKALNGLGDFTVKWNFHKFLIDESGQLVKDLPSSVSPLDESILDWLSA